MDIRGSDILILKEEAVEYLDLKPFEQFIISRNLVPEKYRPYYLGWVRRFLQSGFAAQDLRERDALTCFTDQLERDDAVEEWQVEQAKKSVELYLHVYLREQGSGLSADGGAPAARGRQDAGGTEMADAEALDEMRKLLRLRHYSYKSEKLYLDWAARYLKYAESKRLIWDAAGSVRSFLSHLALDRNVASSTQNQAFNALIFLFRETLGRDLAEIGAVRARRGRKLPVVLSADEVRRLLEQVEGTHALMLRLTYGGGLRVSETIRLRVKDLDFENDLLFVRSGKGDKDRATLLPHSLHEELKAHLDRVKDLHDMDLAKGFGEVFLPGALDKKYPQAPREFKWQYVFPARNLSVDPRSGKARRHHVSEKVMQHALSKAVKAAEIYKHVTVHTLRHSFATHLLMSGTNIREVQELLGHKSLETTMIYTHVVKEMSAKPKSPLDML